MRFSKFNNSLNSFKDPRTLTIGGLLIALYVLSAIIPILHFYISDSIKFSISFIFVVVAAYLYGPVMAAIVGGVGDLLAWVIHPHGMLIIGITLSVALSGVIFGFFYYCHRPTLVRTIVACITESVLIEILLKTLFLSNTFKLPFWATMLGRCVSAAIMLPIMVILSLPMFKLADKLKTATIRKR